jgi:hypothetical protein
MSTAIVEPRSEVTTTPAEQAPITKPWSLKDFLSADEADALYDQMMQLPWKQSTYEHSSDSYGISYGVSYMRLVGGPRPDEIPEIPDFLKVLADRVTRETQVPVNFIECHRFGPSVPVTAHRDPAGMIVPMLVVGQERTFQVGGKIFGKNGKPFPPMASQKSMENGMHEPDEKLLLKHGSLLVFDGGPTFHSMDPADKDAQSNLKDFPYRISLLFRWTTPAMREHGAEKSKLKENGGLKQYKDAVKEFRAALANGSWQQGTLWEPSVTPNTALATVEQEIFPMLHSPAEMPSDQLAESSVLTANNKTYIVRDPRNTGKPRPYTIRIDPEFASLIAPLQSEEYAQLEANIRENGIREPIVVWWDDTGPTSDVVLLDGHHRLAIRAKIDAENVKPSRYLSALVSTADLSSVPDRDAALLWIETNQLGRRNLTDDQRAVVADSIRERRSAIARKERASQAAQASHTTQDESCLSVKTADKQTPETAASVAAVAQNPVQAPAKQDTREDVAKESGVPVSKMRAVAFLKKNAPEKVKDVRAGKLTLRQATKEAKAATTPKDSKPQKAKQKTVAVASSDLTPIAAVEAALNLINSLIGSMSFMDTARVYYNVMIELERRLRQMQNTLDEKGSV